LLIWNGGFGIAFADYKVIISEKDLLTGSTESNQPSANQPSEIFLSLSCCCVSAGGLLWTAGFFMYLLLFLYLQMVS
jgi:hypothetical protein